VQWRASSSALQVVLISNWRDCEEVSGVSWAEARHERETGREMREGEWETKTHAALKGNITFPRFPLDQVIECHGSAKTIRAQGQGGLLLPWLRTFMGGTPCLRDLVTTRNLPRHVPLSRRPIQQKLHVPRPLTTRAERV